MTGKTPDDPRPLVKVGVRNTTKPIGVERLLAGPTPTFTDNPTPGRTRTSLERPRPRPEVDNGRRLRRTAGPPDPGVRGLPISTEED